MLDCLAVGLGGFIGSVGRYLCGKIPVKNPGNFPVQTFFINIIGAFVIGCVVALAAKHASLTPRQMLFLKTGICGGFTTFSTFSLETGDLLRAGNVTTAILYVTLSVVLGVAAVFLAQYIFR